MVATLLAGCGSGDPTASPASSNSAPVPSETPEAVSDLDGCVTADEATLLRHEGESTVARVGVMGDGAAGVVISYEVSRSVCPWLPLAERLVEAGYRVLLYDTVSGTPTNHVVDRAALLVELGAEDVVLVGGSVGGAASIVAATEIEPPVAAVVSLSGGGIDTADAAQALTVPLLQVVAEDDAPFASLARENDAAAVQSPAHELVVFPGRAHASRLFQSPAAEQVLTTIEEFLGVQAPAT